MLGTQKPLLEKAGRRKVSLGFLPRNRPSFVPLPCKKGQKPFGCGRLLCREGLDFAQMEPAPEQTHGLRAGREHLALSRGRQGCCGVGQRPPSQKCSHPSGYAWSFTCGYPRVRAKADIGNKMGSAVETTTEEMSVIQYCARSSALLKHGGHLGEKQTLCNWSPLWVTPLPLETSAGSSASPWVTCR